MAHPDDPEVAALREAVAALPGNLPLRRQLCAALERAGAIEEALATAQAAPVQDGALLLLSARCLYELGRYAEALQSYDRAVALDVSLADAALRERIASTQANPRARLRLVADPQARAASEPPEAESPRLTLADVGGLEDIKEKIRLRVIHPLRRPDLYRAYGKKIGGGLLLYGPPGCGKTFLARATAGEAGIRFFSVGIEEVLDMWIGQSEKRLHAHFQAARQQAPAILFFDEVDALGGRRSAIRHESYRMLVAQFLADLDGIGAGGRGQDEGVLVMGATNAPWDVDPAFRRPGRFSDVLFVPPPDLRGRVEILKLKLRGRPAEGVDVAEVARATELYSGADLEHVVESAAEAALEQSLRTGQVQPLRTADLLAAVRRVRPSTLEWFASARSFATYANEGGQYNDVLDYMRRHRLG
ncbi:MAG: AAA family ATPase [Myxococcales bacterium]|nr:AAA family ATPase [Myxococcota bacterium]MDW8280317.1 AAA family ATPase [Myxococcales bacterium]